MNITRKSISQVVESVLELEARRATVFFDERTVISATRRHKPSKRARTVEIVLKIGQPNYAEREFIALCKKAGEPLPVRKVQLKFWPKK